MSNANNSTTPSVPVDRPWGSVQKQSQTRYYSENPSSYAINRYLNEPKRDTCFDTIAMVKQVAPQSNTRASRNPPSSAGSMSGSSHDTIGI
ncbi:uncharacterized protein PgNI_07274 [Pyricularia grisea]|uniref:Uncharacterized protein n=1 Tax=Pyricularia grisea TaxID=148305 RepID=A0A6P8B390_PYRGI|nr:uncharacterized protein PgNI_07274 [Pyricularia grisea]TLD09380.1 hypothetical protein PgNI_07274 [Pyricularia grisea]